MWSDAVIRLTEFLSPIGDRNHSVTYWTSTEFQQIRDMAINNFYG